VRGLLVRRRISIVLVGTRVVIYLFVIGVTVLVRCLLVLGQ
jgi:hypothetical protein